MSDYEAIKQENKRYKTALKAVSQWFAELNRRGERGPSMDVTEIRHVIHEALYPKDKGKTPCAK